MQSFHYYWFTVMIKYFEIIFFHSCERGDIHKILQATLPSWRQAPEKFGAKQSHLPEYPMSASKFWTQSGDWWILMIHDIILVFSSGRDKNQNGGKERYSSSQGL